MIVDMNRHLWSSLEKHPALREIAKRDPAYKDRHELKVDLPLVPDWEERTRDVIAEMDEAGVDISAMLLTDYSLRLGDSAFSNEMENRIQVELSRQYPDRLIPFFGSDPRRPGTADDFDRATGEGRIRGLSIDPTVGFFPHDRICYPLYEICVQRGVPVIFHSGPAPARLYSRYAQPLQFDDVAADFPELNIILAHSGKDLWPEALSVAREKDNVYLELSLWQPSVKYMGEFLYALDRMRDLVGIDRILWGSGFPSAHELMTLKDWRDIFRQLPSLGEDYGHRFDDTDVDAILGNNALRLLQHPSSVNNGLATPPTRGMPPC